MRILFVQRNAQIGGGLTYLRTVAPELRRRGHETHLMVGWGPCRPLLAEAMETRLAWNLPVRSVAGRILGRIVRARGIQVVDADMPTTALMAAPVCRQLSVPLVLHVHSLAPHEELAAVVADAARIVVMNRSVRDWVAQVPGAADKTILSALPVDTERFRARDPVPHDGFRILYCGRLSRRKAAHVMSILEALGKLEQRIPGVTLTVVGGRSQLRRVMRRAHQVNAALGREAVTVLGEVLNPSGQFAWADLVIGAGYVALEGLACARHVIGVGVTGMVGLVTPESFEACADANFGDHGATERDVTPEKLAAEIIRAYGAWKDSPQAGWAPTVIRDRFSPRRAVDDLERAYADAMRGM